MGQPLAVDPARVRRGREGGQDVVVEEVGEWPVADVVQQARDPQRLDDEAFARGGSPRPVSAPRSEGTAGGPTGRPRA